MDFNDKRVIKQLWENHVKEDFDLDRLLLGIIADGGEDARDLSLASLRDIFEGNFKGDWKIVAFSFSELLAYYEATREIKGRLSEEQTVRWVFATLSICCALDDFAIDLSGEFRKINHMLYLLEDSIGYSIQVYIYQRIFSGKRCSINSLFHF